MTIDIELGNGITLSIAKDGGMNYLNLQVPGSCTTREIEDNAYALSLFENTQDSLLAFLHGVSVMHTYDFIGVRVRVVLSADCTKVTLSMWGKNNDGSLSYGETNVLEYNSKGDAYDKYLEFVNHYNGLYNVL